MLKWYLRRTSFVYCVFRCWFASDSYCDCTSDPTFGVLSNEYLKITKKLKLNGAIFNTSSVRVNYQSTYTSFFISSTFITNARMKLAKNQANAKHHSEAELLLFENYSHSSSTLSSKNNRTCSKNKKKNKCVCIHKITRLILMKMKMKMKNRSPRYRHEHI